MRRKLLLVLPLMVHHLLHPTLAQAATATTTVQKFPWVGSSGKVEGFIIQTIYKA